MCVCSGNEDQVGVLGVLEGVAVMVAVIVVVAGKAGARRGGGVGKRGVRWGVRSMKYVKIPQGVFTKLNFHLY